MAQLNTNRSAGVSGARAERRSHPRVLVFAEVELAGPSGKGKAILRDLSLGGALVLALRPVGRLGETVELSIDALSGVKLELAMVAEIIRERPASHGQLVGLRFLAPPADAGDRQRLHDAIELLRKGIELHRLR